ncbi:hypothetical protein CAC42_1036 [Sphaceloma murrayae]|uniref:U3 small nucleolar RNA-associated protein 22 n=1 Tax=Sphaceloma murrayae TaxID=2082308 RepID=A0A2K1R1T8_9PEZI|nr:hypothetical protein CAC42_1036 [Sphaceloma murrayae]
MAPIAKRRKVAHESDDEDDASSFASFGSGEGGQASPGNDVGVTDFHGQSDDSSSSNDPEHQTKDISDAETGLNGASNHLDSNRSVGASVAAISKAASTPLSKSTSHDKPKKQSERVSASALTGGNVRANLLQLQIDDLLARSRPVRDARAEAAEKALRDLKGLMENIPSRSPLPVAVAERDLVKKLRVAVPFPNPGPPKDAQYKLEYQKPASINIVGSYASGTRVRGTESLEIDMMVQMPDAVFQPKDYQDHRYLYRRSYYLACLAAGIRDAAPSKYSIEFCDHQGNPLRPMLVIRPVQASAEPAPQWQINILLCISPKVFADEKLIPSKMLVRSTDKAIDTDSSPTSLYNSSIQVDRQMTPYLKLIHAAGSTCDDFKDAALLIRLWLGLRGFSSTVQRGGFGNFESTALLASLITSGTVPARYTTYQLFKATLQYLATKDASKEPIIIGVCTSDLELVPDIPQMIDGPRCHNLLYKMTASSYKLLRAEARNTIFMLGDNSSDHFEAALVRKEDTVHLKFDLVMTLPSSHLADQVTSDRQVLQSQQKLYKTLARGLGDRVSAIRIQSAAPGHWGLGSARPSWKTKGITTVAVRFNPANAGRAIDHGPPAELKQEAAEFRKFWGDKAELRRFKDGSILESVVWSAEESDQALIIEIIRCIMSRHFGESPAVALQPLGGDVTKLIPDADGTMVFQPLMDAFKTLENDIRSLDDLPLTIRQISPADEKACFSSIDIPSLATPVEVVLQFESSTRWPNSLTAIQRTKAAFLLYLSRLITRSHSSVTCQVGLENHSSSVLNQSFLDVYYPTVTFRLRLHHDLELAFLQSQLKSPNISPPQRELTALALASYKRTFVLQPSHTSYITKLATIHPSLSPAIRLLKSWFRAHLLTSHFPTPLIELLALRPFLVPHPYPTPSSPKTGFLRALAFLSTWDWRTSPLLFPPAMEDVDKDTWMKTARTRFEAWRKLDPGMNRVVLFVAYGSDGEGTGWTDVTQGGPGRVVAGRMTALAKAAMAEIERTEMDVRVLMKGDVGDYDFVIRIGREFLGKGKTRGKGKGGKEVFKNLEVQGLGTAEVGFDPVGAFVEEVKGLYGGAVVLFYGGRGSEVVGGLWNPVTEKRAWKVGLGWSSVPIIEEGEAVAGINKVAILGEMARLGGELVERIDVRK